MRIAEPRASNPECLYVCELRVFKAVLDGATCLATGEEGFTVTHRGNITPGKRNTKTLHLYSSIASNQSAESVA